MAGKSPTRGRCPHCGRVQPLVNANMVRPVMRAHLYRDAHDRMVKCPGEGRAPVNGTER